MKHYRLKVEETIGGKKTYTPQVGTSFIKGTRYIYLTTRWENILVHNSDCNTSQSTRYIYDNEPEALEAIETYKQYLDGIDKKKLKSVYYINL